MRVAASSDKYKIEAQCSVDNNEEDGSAATLTDLRRLLERLNIAISADEELANEDQEGTNVIMNMY